MQGGRVQGGLAAPPGGGRSCEEMASSEGAAGRALLSLRYLLTGGEITGRVKRSGGVLSRDLPVNQAGYHNYYLIIRVRGA